MKKRYFALPHGYLSHSQMQLWLNNPERYKKQYFDGFDTGFSNSGQNYGKVVADALEAGRDTGDILTDASMLLLKKYDVADQPILAEFKEKGGPWLQLIAKPDTLNSIDHSFREYKTGKHPWTQEKAQNHPQMLFYAVVIWLKYGTMNTNAWLDWIETELVPGESGELGPNPTYSQAFPMVVKPTGLVKSFEVTFTQADYYEFQAKMLKVAHSIEEAWAAHETPAYITDF